MSITADAIAKILEEKKEAIKDDIAGLEKVYQIKFEDKPEENYYIQISGGEVKVEKGEHSSPDVTFIATLDTFTKIVTGELDATAAYMSGQLKIEGSLPDAITFGNILQKLR
ncbi:MAG: SCP2 sterol-binding domain-containing protein [Candidatus Baldrarchaeia archaeon]